MRRPVARFLFVFVFGTLATVLGIVTSMTLTPPGRDLLARMVSSQLARVIKGSVEIGAISGSFLYDLTFEGLVVRDTQGVLLARLPRVRVGYRLPNLLRGNIVLSGVELDDPTIWLIKYRNGRMNYEDVLGLGKGPGGGKSPLIEFHNVRINDGTLRIALPWNPSPTLATADQRDSALVAERAKPGRMIEESRDGLRRVILFRDLTTAMSRLRISTPDRRPFTIDLDSLATRINDPGVTLTDAKGRVIFRGDSAIFSLERGAMPASVFAGGGAVTWPKSAKGAVLFDFQMQASRVALADLRWVSPFFPDMTGTGVLAAKSESPTLTAYVLRDLHLAQGAQRIDGELVALQDRTRGIGVRDMDLALRNVDLDAVRPYLDTLPFYGTITGSLRGSGYLDRMRVALDWLYADAEVAGRPVSHIVADGTVGATRNGLVFDRFNLRDSDIDLGTARRLAPAVVVPGRLVAVGSLNGPLADVTFRGTARHRDGDRPQSALSGVVHLDTRGEELAVNIDVDLDPLSFEGIRRGFPSFGARGSVRGHVTMDGALSRMAVSATLTGEIGDIDARGVVTMLPPRWGADQLSLVFTRLDLAALRGSGPTTSLNGSLLASGVIDTLRAPVGTLELALGRSRIREWIVDTTYTRVAVADSVIRLDTLYTEWKGARGGGSGTLGWARPHTGTMALSVTADSLMAFDSLLLAVSGQARDSTDRLKAPLSGSATAALTLIGSLDTLGVDGRFTAADVAFQGYRAPALTGSFTSTGGARPVFAFEVRSDSVALRTDTTATGTWGFPDFALAARGRPDSLEWALGTGVAAATRIDAAGRWLRAGGLSVVGVDSLRAQLASRLWRLAAPTTLTLSDSAPLLGPTELAAVDGSGLIRVSGRLPRHAAGDLAIDAFGVDVRDVYDILGRDTTGVAGAIGINAQVGGTAAAPHFRGIATLADARFGDARLPFVQGVLDYADRRLEANLAMWRTGEPVLSVAAQLPIDLALTGVTNRQLDGPISVRAVGDSVELAIVEAFVPTIDRVSGYFDTDVEIRGTWKAPELAGSLAITDGAMTLPSLGVRWDSLNGRAAFSGDSLVLQDVRIASGEGGVDVHGVVKLEELSRPVLAVEMDADHFDVMDVRNFLELTASGHFDLQGPFYGATFTGSGTANSGVLYFADLLNKQVIDLDDPSNLDLVDTLLIRRRGLREGFTSRFIEELRVDDFQLTIGTDFWLRSSEANIKLRGDVTVDKILNEYRPEGTLEAERGNYTLRIGPVTRDFTVERGNVRYFGTPDLNADLDIQARHVVRAANGQEIPVIANITGSLLEPRLRLSSDPTITPPLAEVDLVSYLILGLPAGQAQGIQQNAIQNTMSILTSALSSDLERAIVADLGLPVDLIEIRPALAGGTIAGGNITQLAAGWQVGSKLFLRLNAGFCSQNGATNVGASLDFRFSRSWRLQGSFEPTYRTCRVVANAFRPSSSYQIGFDVLWDREF